MKSVTTGLPMYKQPLGVVAGRVRRTYLGLLR
jgi:hypothetical protein